LKAKPFPIHVRRPGSLAILTLLGASGRYGRQSRDLSVPNLRTAPAGLSRLSGFTDTIPDVVGRIDSHASLVIFSEGNHFPVLLPLALDGFRGWLRQKGYALRNDNVVVVTLPQPMLVSALGTRRHRVRSGGSSGRLGGWSMARPCHGRG
jgi:hypothetical protein